MYMYMQSQLLPPCVTAARSRFSPFIFFYFFFNSQWIPKQSLLDSDIGVQTPVARTLTRTSPGLGGSRGRSLMVSGAPLLSKTAALKVLGSEVVIVLQIRSNRRGWARFVGLLFWFW